jgi:hypothetical protein
MRTQLLLPSCCCSINPKPCLLVSVRSRAGLQLSKNARVGLDVSDSLAVRKELIFSAKEGAERC